MSTRITPGLSPRLATAIITVGVMVIILLVVQLFDSASRQQDKQREATAHHWAQAGLTNPSTTLKDNGNKNTVGMIDKCRVTVEGFTSYTSVVVTTDQGSPSLRQELTFQSGLSRTDPDQAAFDYISRLPGELAAFCSVG